MLLCNVHALVGAWRVLLLSLPGHEQHSVARQRTALSDAVHLLVRPGLDVDPAVRNSRSSRPEAFRVWGL
jgi:hypothetical protein